MGKSKHRAGVRVNEFCTKAPSRSKCKCGNNFRTNAKFPSNWGFSGGVAFFTSKQLEASGGKPPAGLKMAGKRSFEAHHLICVSPITAAIQKQIDIEKNQSAATAMMEIIRSTKWCVNEEINMLPMPMWGHTVKHYAGNPNQPPNFADICQHDWDHNPAYTDEVVSSVKQVLNKIKKAAKKHDIPDGSLAADLHSLSKELKSKLESRGKRKNGTHSAWNAKECAPFSMASNNKVSKRGFPPNLHEDKLADWKTRLGVA